MHFYFILFSWATLALSQDIWYKFNPLKFPDRCGRKGIEKTGICDPFLILSTKDKDIIDGLMSGITTARVTLAVVKRIGDPYTRESASKVEAAKLQARDMSRKWV